MADRASAIIISKRHILLIHRFRKVREYYVFPGGHIEPGESAEEACSREVLEETGLHVAWMQAAFDFLVEARMARFFFVQVHPGTLALGGPEINKQNAENRYLLEWVPLAGIGTIPLQPVLVRDALVKVLSEDGPVREASDLALHANRLQQLLNQM